MPSDLKYVTLAESDLRNRSLSHAGAVGTWQFMGPTAQRFHLLVTPAVDERQDFSPSTDAALDYLKGLRQQLGSWALALAAYNCGENRVQKEKDLQRVDNIIAWPSPRKPSAMSTASSPPRSWWSPPRPTVLTYRRTACTSPWSTMRPRPS